ncbi:hypothetical protein SanaruYs_12320 [Chryseotalea sanaruensis]|uniref:Uncharacterized protein n=1 Tax=Chryseotalea sanaruensis TaxID=2482724 RepID=A0A401U7Z9_9BACT|nr:hypothetical protein [Chryseotalea sanaruensis]GCC51012.1 hypothetical protein SanaruYs_12320 [Chryseotalea sanaruensis]
MKQPFIIILFVSLFAIQSNGQAVLNKLKQKAEQAADRAIDKKLSGKQGTKNTGDNANNGNNNPSNNSSNPNNKGGGGLISTPPDVSQNLSDAEVSYKTKNYGEARYAVQQAMLGVEMEIGNDILKSLPESVSGLPKEESADQVTSTGYGWVGLTIHREYLKDDKQLTVTVANNSVWMASYNMYMTNAGYGQTTGGEQQFKQIKVKGYRGVIEYSESSGYKISVGIGQSSIIVWEGINFANEQEITKAAEAFDIDAIKNKLGEQ